MSLLWKIIGTKEIIKNKYFTAKVDKCLLPNGVTNEAYYSILLPTCVCGIGITQSKQIIVIEQYRHPIGKAILELPGGFVDEGELPIDAIAREFEEETGYTFKKISFVGKAAANPGILNNYTHFFILWDGEKTEEQNLDEMEQINIKLMEPTTFITAMDNNEFEQALHISCFYFARNEIKKIL